MSKKKVENILTREDNSIMVGPRDPYKDLADTIVAAAQEECTTAEGRQRWRAVAWSLGMRKYEGVCARIMLYAKEPVKYYMYGWYGGF